jgi:hypothetical protein
LTEWAAYDRLEPIGEGRGDARAALIASTFANVMRGEGQQPQPLRDFLLVYDEADRGQSWETQLQQAKMITKALKGRVRGDDR